MLLKSTLLLLVLTAASFSQSQKDSTGVIDTSGISNYSLFEYIDSIKKEDYAKLLDSLKKYNTTDFFRLRMAYTKTDDYDPYSVHDGDVFTAVYGKLDSSDFNAAKKLLEDFLKAHYVNIRAHLLSGYVNKMLQDTILAGYHYRIYDGLIKSMIESGDGRSCKTAFIVISTKEEYDLIKAFGMRSEHQSLIESDGYSFDLMEVKEENSEKNEQMYFNVLLPMKHLSESFKK